MKSDPSNILKIISAPLGFFVLALLIVETFLGATLFSGQVPPVSIFHCIYLGVGMFVLVVLIVAAIVWYKPGHLTLDKDGHLTLLKNERRQTRMQHVPSEVAAITASPSAIDAKTPIAETDLFVVIDIQNDFIDGALAVANASDLIPGINDACRAAQQAKMLIAFTRDWHPADHCTFKSTRRNEHDTHAVHADHCVAGTPGAEFHLELDTLVDHIIVDFGNKATILGYSPLENAAFRTLVSSDRIKRIFVAGIALEYCVQACCIDLRKLNKIVIAVEPLIAKAKTITAENEILWTNLEEAGVIRSRTIPDELQTVP